MEVPAKSLVRMVVVLALAAALPLKARAQAVENTDSDDLDMETIFSFMKPMLSEGGRPPTQGGILSLLPSSAYINANEDIDRLMNLLSPLIPNNYKVPDIGTDMNLHDCFVDGLSSSIVRAGDVALNLTDGRLSLSFGLAVNEISLQCSWKRKIFVMTLIGTGKADVNKVGVSTVIGFDFQPGAHPTLDDFSVLHLDDIKTSFTGLGFLNKLAGKLGDVLIKSSRERIINKLEGDVARRLQKLLNRVKMPKL